MALPLLCSRPGGSRRPAPTCYWRDHLTTNLKSSIDKAFDRRILFHVEFPLPDAGQRRRIWKVLWPAKLPSARDVDLRELAQEFEFSGGEIRNCLLRAALVAHAANRIVDQGILLDACQWECERLGRLVRAE